MYLDLNTIIYFARTLRSITRFRQVTASYSKRLREPRKRSGRCFRSVSRIFWEITKITDPKKRVRLAEVLESLSDFNYLLGRITIAELEFDAGMAKIVGEEPRLGGVPLLRPTFGQVFGVVGGLNVVDADGLDVSETLRAQMDADEYTALRATMHYEVERHMLRGPSDAELAELRKDPNYRPEVAIASHQSRVEWELETERILTKHPERRRGRLRDAIGAREIVHEWNDLFARLRVERINAGLPAFEPSNDQVRSFSRGYAAHAGCDQLEDPPAHESAAQMDAQRRL